jgi:hypothetical protein
VPTAWSQCGSNNRDFDSNYRWLEARPSPIRRWPIQPEMIRVKMIRAEARSTQRFHDGTASRAAATPAGARSAWGSTSPHEPAPSAQTPERTWPAAEIWQSSEKFAPFPDSIAVAGFRCQGRHSAIPIRFGVLSSATQRNWVPGTNSCTISPCMRWLSGY